MFFFEDNNYVLVKGDPLGERSVSGAAAQHEGTVALVVDLGGEAQHRSSFHLTDLELERSRRPEVGEKGLTG